MAFNKDVNITWPALKKHLILSSLVFLMLFTSAISGIALLFPQSVQAAVTASQQSDVATKNAEWRATSFYFYHAMLSCMEVDNWNNETPGDIRSGNWFNDNYTVRMYYGRALQQDVDSDGTFNCNANLSEVSKAALQFWGIDPMELYCAIMGNAPRPGSQSPDCVNGTGAMGFESNEDAREANFKAAIQAAVYNNRAVGGVGYLDTDKAMGYAFHLRSFQMACAPAATPVENKDSIDPDVPQDKIYEIGWPTPDGDVVNMFIVGSSAASADKFFFDTAPGDAIKRTCQQLASSTLANQVYAQAYKLEVSTYPENIISGSAFPYDNTGYDYCRQNVSMGWLVCPILNWIDGAISGLESAIITVLRVDQLYNDDDSAIYAIWGNMRNLALIILIPMMLVMVIGTALQFGPFDAYTVKKALPRMVAAVIFIMVSWDLCTFLIDLADIVGAGVQGLILGAAGIDTANNPLTLATLVERANLGGAVAGTGAAAGVAGFALLSLGQLEFGILFSLMLSAMMALLIGYISLAIRLILILGMLVMAPLFILSWIFPGNDKMWKFWKTSFFGMLLLFPLIMGAIAIGKLGAYIISGMDV